MKNQCLENAGRTPRRGWLALAWLTISAAAAYDVYFAWAHRHVLATWELNPLIVWATGHVGLLAVCAFKLVGLALTGGLVWRLQRTRRSLAQHLTVFVLAVHGALALLYAVGHQQPTHYDLACREAARLAKQAH